MQHGAFEALWTPHLSGLLRGKALGPIGVVWADLPLPLEGDMAEQFGGLPSERDMAEGGLVVGCAGVSSICFRPCVLPLAGFKGNLSLLEIWFYFFFVRGLEQMEGMPLGGFSGF